MAGAPRSLEPQSTAHETVHVALWTQSTDQATTSQAVAPVQQPVTGRQASDLPQSQTDAQHPQESCGRSELHSVSHSRDSIVQCRCAHSECGSNSISEFFLKTAVGNVVGLVAFGLALFSAITTYQDMRWSERANALQACASLVSIGIYSARCNRTIQKVLNPEPLTKKWVESTSDPGAKYVVDFDPLLMTGAITCIIVIPLLFLVVYRTKIRQTRSPLTNAREDLLPVNVPSNMPGADITYATGSNQNGRTTQLLRRRRANAAEEPMPYVHASGTYLSHDLTVDSDLDFYSSIMTRENESSVAGQSNPLQVDIESMLKDGPNTLPYDRGLEPMESGCDRVYTYEEDKEDETVSDFSWLELDSLESAGNEDSRSQADCVTESGPMATHGMQLLLGELSDIFNVETKTSVQDGPENTLPRDVRAFDEMDSSNSWPLPANGTSDMVEKVTKARRRLEMGKKESLARALQKVNTAILLDNANNAEGALDSYGDACKLIQSVIDRSSREDDRKKLNTIKFTYMSRCEELRQLKLSQIMAPNATNVPADRVGYKSTIDQALTKIDLISKREDRVRRAIDHNAYTIHLPPVPRAMRHPFLPEESCKTSTHR